MTVLAVLSNNAIAEWTEVGAANNYIAYVDESTIRRDGYLVKMWGLEDYQSTQKNRSIKYLSEAYQQEFDCKNEQIKYLAHLQMSDNMGNGNAVATSSKQTQWSPFKPGSIGERRWKIACGLLVRF